MYIKMIEQIDNTDFKSESKNLSIAIYHKYFTDSLIEILDIVISESEKNNLDCLDLNNKSQKKIYNSHERLRKTCLELKNGFNGTDTNYDQARIIKKIYRVVTQHLTKLYPTPQMNLFELKNDDGATITIIPGLDIQLILKQIENQTLEKLWDYFYMMYISSVIMITEINEHKKNGKVWEILPRMKERVIKSGMFSQEGKFFNPFIGVMPETTHDQKIGCNIDTMFESVEKQETPSGPSFGELMSIPGMDKAFNIDQLNEQLKNVNPEEIEDATKNIAKLLGAENDSDVQEVCSTLVGGIVEEMKYSEGGLQGMVKVAEKVSEKIGKKIDRQKMQKTANQLNLFIKDSEKTLKNFKDKDGNPIGEKIFDTLKGPLAGMQNSNGELNMGNMANIFTQVSSALNQMNNTNNSQNKPTKTNKTKVAQK